MIETRTVNGAPEYYDGNTHETIWRAAPLAFYDDFLRHKDFSLSRAMAGVEDWIGSAGDEELHESAFDQYATDGLPWDVTETDGEHVTLVPSIEGKARLGITTGNATQICALHWGDNCILNRAGLVWEARVALATLPTADSATGEDTVAVWGVASEHNATLGSIITGAWFYYDSGSGLRMQADDNTTATPPKQTTPQTTLVADVWHVYRIELSGSEAIFKYDGAEVGRLTFAPTANLQPYFRLSKTLSTGNESAGAMLIDYCKAWSSRP